MARRGKSQRIANLQLGGRELRIQAKLRSYEGDLEEFESEVLEVVRNLDKGVRSETMYEIASKTVKRAKEIIQDHKQDSQAFSDINIRSERLEDRLNFTWTETDKIVIEPPADIPYASINDSEDFIEITPVDAPALRFYWFRHAYTRTEPKAVYRQGSGYLSRAIDEEATESKIRSVLYKWIDYYWDKGSNLTGKGGNLGGNRRRSHKSPSERRRDSKRS